MKLAYWQYAGPAHIGTLRVAASFQNVHAIMHGPLGDDYFNVMRSMLERERDITPVTASIVDKQVLAAGSGNRVTENLLRKQNEERPALLILTPTCTSSILQENLQNFVERISEQHTAILADVNHYRVNELQAADRTFEQVVRTGIEQFEIEHFVKEIKLSPEDFEQYKNKNRQLACYADQAYKSLILESKEEDFIPSLRRLVAQHHPSVNVLGPLTLGFHNEDDCREFRRLLNDIGIQINSIFPEGATFEDISKLPNATFNIVPYREVGLATAEYLQKTFGTPYTSITPFGVIETKQFLKEILYILEETYSLRDQELPKTLKTKKYRIEDLPFIVTDETHSTYSPKNRYSGSLNREIQLQSSKKSENSSFSQQENLNTFPKQIILDYIESQQRFISQTNWFNNSIDAQNLTGKNVVVFGDATHAAYMTKFLVREMGINVVCAGTYSKNDCNWFREQVHPFCNEILLSDDHTQVNKVIVRLQPNAIFGTQMERHIGKRLGISCGVISAPVHIQNFTLGYRPMIGFEGASVLVDLVYNTLTLGMEDHLLELFGGHDSKMTIQEIQNDSNGTIKWDDDALKELNLVPGFIRQKVKMKVENYANSKGFTAINVATLYEAKEAATAE